MIADDLHGRRIDVHTHSGAMPNVHRLESGEDLVHVEREAGVEKAIVSSARGVFYDMVSGNADTLAVVHSNPMLYMYVYVDPHRVDASLAEMEKYVGKPHVAGIKTRHGYHGVAADCPAYLTLFKRAAKLGLPCLAHAYSLREVTELHRAAEKTGEKVVLAHMGATQWKESTDFVRGSERVWLDASTSVNDYDKIGYALDVLGVARLVFGSDSTLLSPWWTISMFESAGLTDAEKHAVYRDNALTIFGKRLA
jgi:predicted TIM-barrel fold metal-dependent hydrolase